MTPFQTINGLITTPSARMFSSSCFCSSSRRGGIMLANSGSMVRCRDIGSYLSTGVIPVSRSRLDVVVETIAGLAVSTDILRVYLKTQNCTKRQEKDIKGFYHRQYKEVIA